MKDRLGQSSQKPNNIHTLQLTNAPQPHRLPPKLRICTNRKTHRSRGTMGTCRPSATPGVRQNPPATKPPLQCRGVLSVPRYATGIETRKLQMHNNRGSPPSAEQLALEQTHSLLFPSMSPATLALLSDDVSCPLIEDAAFVVVTSSIVAIFGKPFKRTVVR